MNYVGRFAPSPTGPLHLGSLVAAVGSWLEARSYEGKWLVRMEDIDPPREQAGAADAILKSLDAYGFEWDGEVLFQSRRTGYYRYLLEKLAEEGKAFRCTCSRKELQELGFVGAYPGRCREGWNPEKKQWSWRADVRGAGTVAFRDALQGRIETDLEKEAGDFIIWRADGLVAYQLAVTADDGEQGVTHVVRGSDIMDSTPKQLWLQRLLGLREPKYLHLPVVLGEDGQKLSKQNLAAPIPDGNPGPFLVKALRFLGQEPPEGLEKGTPSQIWAWAFDAYDREKLPRKLGAYIPQ